MARSAAVPTIGSVLATQSASHATRELTALRSMLTARWVDAVEAELVQRGEAFALRSEDTDKADVVVYGMRTPPAWRNFQAGPDPDAVQGPVPEQPLPTWGYAY